MAALWNNLPWTLPPPPLITKTILPSSLNAQPCHSLPTSFPSLSSSRPYLSQDPCIPILASNPLKQDSYDYSWAVHPSISYANTLFFKSAYNVQVVVGEDEPEEVLLRRFKREVFRAGIIQESKRRRFFENKQEKTKRKVREAAKRNSRRRRPPPKVPPLDDKEASKKSKDQEEEDNWDLPEGELPY